MKNISAKQFFKDALILFWTFFKIGLFCFGGGYAMLSLIEAEVVDKHNWITKQELGDIFAIAESTPGPISINTATFIGVKRLGILGGIIATFGVVLPSFCIIAALSVVIGFVKDNVWVNCLFRGIRIGVVVLIFKAVLSFFKDMKKTAFSFLLMTASFLLVFLIKANVIYIILATILISSLFVAFSTAYKKRRFFMTGVAPYYSQLVGKPIEQDEYYSEYAVKNGKIKIKNADCAIKLSIDGDGGESR